jgi:hypothetical protein
MWSLEGKPPYRRCSRQGVGRTQERPCTYKSEMYAAIDRKYSRETSKPFSLRSRILAMFRSSTHASSTGRCNLSLGSDEVLWRSSRIVRSMRSFWRKRSSGPGASMGGPTRGLPRPADRGHIALSSPGHDDSGGLTCCCSSYVQSSAPWRGCSWKTLFASTCAALIRP